MKRSAKSIFESICELPPDSQSSKLDQLCGDDAPLRREVQSLIDADALAGEFLIEPTLDSVGPGISPAFSFGSPARLRFFS